MAAFSLASTRAMTAFSLASTRAMVASSAGDDRLFAGDGSIFAGLFAGNGSIFAGLFAGDGRRFNLAHCRPECRLRFFLFGEHFFVVVVLDGGLGVQPIANQVESPRDLIA